MGQGGNLHFVHYGAPVRVIFRGTLIFVSPVLIAPAGPDCPGLLCLGLHRMPAGGKMRAGSEINEIKAPLMLHFYFPEGGACGFMIKGAGLSGTSSDFGTSSHLPHKREPETGDTGNLGDCRMEGLPKPGLRGECSAMAQNNRVIFFGHN